MSAPCCVGIRTEASKAIWADDWENRANFYDRIKETIKIQTNRCPPYDADRGINHWITVWKCIYWGWCQSVEDSKIRLLMQTMGHPEHTHTEYCNNILSKHSPDFGLKEATVHRISERRNLIFNMRYKRFEVTRQTEEDSITYNWHSQSDEYGHLLLIFELRFNFSKR